MKNALEFCKQIPLPEENCHVHHNADFRVRPTIKVLQHPPPREPTNYLIVEFKLAYSLLASNGQWGTTGQDYSLGMTNSFCSPERRRNTLPMLFSAQFEMGFATKIRYVSSGTGVLWRLPRSGFV